MRFCLQMRRALLFQPVFSLHQLALERGAGAQNILDFRLQCRDLLLCLALLPIRLIHLKLARGRCLQRLLQLVCQLCFPSALPRERLVFSGRDARQMQHGVLPALSLRGLLR